MPKEWSFYARYFYPSDLPRPHMIKPFPKRNGPIHTEIKKIRKVVYLEAEAETCGTFNNIKRAFEML